MKIESARRYSLSIALVCALVSALPAASIAASRQGTGSHACGCLCDVQFGNGKWAEVASNFSVPSQYGCQSALGMTCNVSDPTTGGVRTGTLQYCQDGHIATAHVNGGHIRPPVTNPGGGLLQAVPMR